MAVNERVRMDGVWLVYYAFPNEGVEGNAMLTINGFVFVPKKDVIDRIKSVIFEQFDAKVKEQCGSPGNMVIRGLTRIGELIRQ